LALPTWNFNTLSAFIYMLQFLIHLFYAYPTNNANIYYSLYICEMIICQLGHIVALVQTKPRGKSINLGASSARKEA